MKRDSLIAALLEAGLLGLAAMLAYVLHQPLIFASLGPTAFEMVETPERPSARPYNVLVGHGIGIVAGLFALFLTHAFTVPPVSSAGLPGLRVFSVVVAGLLTVLGTLWLKATQPAALSTTLLVALGLMQTPKSVLCIAGSVLLFAVVGEPLRRYRLRSRNEGNKP